MRGRIFAAFVASMMSLPALAQTPDLDKFAGAYRATSILVFHVHADGDHLVVGVGGGQQMALVPQGQGRFADLTANAQFSFSDDGMTLTASNGSHVLRAGRISEEAAKALEDAVAARFKADVPAPGTEGSVRRYIESLEKGAPNYDEMEPRVVEDVRPQEAGMLGEIRKLGALKSLTFTVVTSNGMDVYDAAFEHGHVMVGLAPLDAEGKVEFRSWSPRQ